MLRAYKQRGNLFGFLLFLLLLALAVGALSIWRMMHPEPHSSSNIVFHGESASLATEKNFTTSDRLLESMDSEFTSLVDRAIPSVVSITTTAAPDRQALVRQFFGLGGKNTNSASKMGSGMIVSPDGYIVTNWHVLNGAAQVSVQLSDSRILPAHVAGVDQRSDIAVLKIDAEGLTPIEFGDSEGVRVGQMVFAVGNPFGLQETVTQGIISAKGRRTTSEAANEFFQTSTTINPGNSGGPLIDIHGKVIGINNFILSSSGGSEGIGFAIPSNVARRVYEDIVHLGHVIHPWFGILWQPLTPTLARQLGLPDTQGALVAATYANSPAEQSGLLAGDLILSFNGRPIRDGKELRNRIAEAQVGTPVKYTILRAGQSLELSVIMEEEPPH
jgi:Do/DeqQ family serine protease